MSKNKFSNPPIDKDREQRVEAFINLTDERIDKHTLNNERPKKSPIKPIYLRAPESLWQDIHDMMALTGLSMNAICLEILRPEVKRKLKELKD